MTTGAPPLRRFRFIADARLDDVMSSYASDGGGVGPHVDSYDVFLFQTQGRRAGGSGARPEPRLRDEVPLKILTGFVAERGAASSSPATCSTCRRAGATTASLSANASPHSIGFRAPRRAILPTDCAAARRSGPRRRRFIARRAALPATRVAAADRPARIPESLQRFAATALERLLADRVATSRALGEVLSEPKPGTWFERAEVAVVPAPTIALARRTRMLYDERFVFINGEATEPADAMRHSCAAADRRRLDAKSVAGASVTARELLAEWLNAGWCVAEPERFDEETT